MTSVFGYCKGDPNIPIDELDYGFIEKCKDINKLQKILEILRSGEEGRYPALEQFTEKQLAKEKPDSPLLEKCNKEKMMQDIPKDDIDMKKTVDELNNLSSNPVVNSSENRNADDNLPPIRSSKFTENIKEKEHEVVSNDSNKDKNVAPKSPEYWENLSKQVEVEDGDFENICKEKSTNVHVNNKTQLRPADELLTQHKLNVDKSHEDPSIAAQNEKNKGNEAFRCGDFKEALIYYNRSLDILPTAASYNNRAITLIKLEKFKQAVNDCEKVISLEPNNIKAYMRRGIANQSLEYVEKALEDFTKVVELEPKNKRGKELLEKVSKELEKKNLNARKKGKRLKIEEINTNISVDVNIKDKNVEKNEENFQIGGFSVDETVDSGSCKSDIPGNIGSESKDAASRNAENKQCGKDFNDNEKLESLNSIQKCVNNVMENNEIYTSVNDSMGNIGKQKDIDHAEKNNKTVQNSEINVNTKNNDLGVSTKGSEKLGIYKEESFVEVNEQTVGKAVIKELPGNVNDLKNKGNTLFKTGLYDEACEMYTLCINTLLEDESGYKDALATLFSNRSSCQMRMGNSKQCIYDCDKSVEFSQSAKVYFKRATAYESLEKYLNAYVDYQNALQLDSSYITALQAFSRLGNVLRSQYGNNWREKLPKTDSVRSDKQSLNTNFRSINFDRKEQPHVSNYKDMDENKESEPSKNTIHPDQTSSGTLDQINTSKTSSDEGVQGKLCENSSEKIDIIINDTSTENSNKQSPPEENNLPVHNESKAGQVDAENVPRTTVKQTCDNQRKEPVVLESEKEKKNGTKINNDSKKRDLGDSKISKEKLAKEKKILEFFETKEKGNNCVQQDKYEEAAEYYTKCVELLPAEIPSYTNRALCFLKLMQPEKAIEDCSQALKLQPSSVKALFRRAQGRKMTKEYKEALADLTKVLKLEPNNNAAKKEMEHCKAEFCAALRNIQAQNEAAKLKDSMGKSKKVPIEEVLSEAAEFSIKGKMSTKVGKCPLAKGSTSRTTQLKKMTGFEFLHAWNNVKSNKTTEYADLLMQIDASKLLDLLSNKLDGEILKNFIRTVNEHFTNKETYKQGIQLLKYLCKASRFVTMLMFLNTTEKTLLRCTIDLLENRVKQSSEKSLLSDISSLRTSYRCP